MQLNYQERLKRFLNSPFIQAIAMEPRWTISHPIDKKPMDAYQFMIENRLVGASFNRGYNPLTELPTLVDWLADQNMWPTNLAYYLNCEVNRQFILDIESTCPKEISDNFIKTLPWEYAETSLSGQGIHLGLTLPENHTLRFDKLSVLKSPNNDYEYLFNNHYITFTMNPINTDAPTPADAGCITDIINPLYKNWAEKQSEKKDFTFSTTKPNIPEESFILRIMENAQFNKSLSDYGNDHSRYEFACGCSFLYRIKKLLDITRLKDITYTESMIVWLVYSCLMNYLEPREKHETYRDNLPWLLYQAQQIVAKLGGK